MTSSVTLRHHLTPSLLLSHLSRHLLEVLFISSTLFEIVTQGGPTGGLFVEGDYTASCVGFVFLVLVRSDMRIRLDHLQDGRPLSLHHEGRMTSLHIAPSPSLGLPAGALLT